MRELAGPLARAAERARAVAAGTDDGSAAHDDVDVASWVAGLDVSVEARDYLLAFAGGMGGAPPAHQSLLPLVVDGIEADYTFDDAFAISESFAGGTVALVDAIARGLDIRLGP
jgi:hypothetical protein